MVQDRADALIAELGASMGIPQLALDARGSCRLVFDRTIAVAIGWEPASAHLMLVSPLGALPAGASGKAMLAANYLWQETRGATVAHGPGGAGLILQRQIAVADTDFARFRSELSAFVTAAEALRSRVPQLTSESAAPMRPFHGLTV